MSPVDPVDPVGRVDPVGGVDPVGRVAPVDAAALDLGEAVEAVARRLPDAPEVVVVLGSGLGGLIDAVEDPVEIPFAEIPGLPGAGVEGHAGRYVAGRLDGRRVLVQAGRYHVYEGHPMEVVAAPVRIAHGVGARTLILTNAAGGAGRHLAPGSIMLIDDHVNLMWRSPLVGAVREGEERFPDMSAPWSPELQALALAVAAELHVPLERGTYAAVAGPSYETPAEVRMLVRCGADAIGMSTVPEVLVARARGMRCLGFSLITNRASGLSPEPLSHEEVLETGRTAGGALQRLVRGVVGRLP